MTEDFYRTQIELLGLEGLENYNFTPTLVDPTLCAYVSAARKAGNIIPVLGAGMSYPSGLPGWEFLIQSAARKMLSETAIPGAYTALQKLQLSPLVQVRIIEAVVGLKATFRSYLLSRLYEKFNASTPNPNLDGLCDFIFGSGVDPILRDIITYNFDNLLEITLRDRITKNGLPLEIVSVYSERTLRDSKRKNTIRVLHPHGYLPYGEDFSKLVEIPIVFSETDFHEHFLNSTYWANITQIEAFSTARCLFLGLSFSDGNLRRLLDYVRFRDATVRHVAIKALHRDTLMGPTQHLENFVVEQDLESLGIRTLWIEDHRQLPAVLSTVMK